MFIFGLHSTSDDQLSNPSDESQLKCNKMATKLSKRKCLFLDYIQLLMIDQAIQVMKVTQNAKKMATKLSKNEMQFLHPPPQMRWGWDRNGMGTGQGWDRYGTGMGLEWDRYGMGGYRLISCRWRTTPLTAVP